jgi:hypothetical protein
MPRLLKPLLLKGAPAKPPSRANAWKVVRLRPVRAPEPAITPAAAVLKQVGLLGSTSACANVPSAVLRNEPWKLLATMQFAYRE